MNEQGFFRQNFDKLLLATLFLIAFGFFLHFSRSMEFFSNAKNSESLSDVIHWLENIIGQILAALLTMMVGRSMAATAHAGPSGKVEVTAGDTAVSTASTESPKGTGGQ